MDESCSIQAPSSSCIKKNETTEVVSQKSNFEGSPHLFQIAASHVNHLLLITYLILSLIQNTLAYFAS